MPGEPPRRSARSGSKKTPTPQKRCAICSNTMSGDDQHTACVLCLGKDHAEKGLEHGSRFCAACGQTAQRILKKRLKRFEEPSSRTEEPMATDQAEQGKQDTARAASPRPPHGDNAESWADQAEIILPLQDTDLTDPAYDYGAIQARSEYDEDEEGDDGEEESGSFSASGAEEEDDDEEEEEDEVLDASVDVELPATQPQAEATAVPAAAAATTPVAVVQSATTPETPTAIKVDDAEFHVLLKRAATRLNLEWPQQEGLAPPSSVFDGIGGIDARRTTRQFLPWEPAVVSFATASWSKPFTYAHAYPRHLDTVNMREKGFDSLPPVERGLASHFLSQSMLSDGSFADKNDKEFSAINRRAYADLAASTRALNATTLLAGSATQIMKAAGDAPTPDQLAEMRRINNEILLLTKTALQNTGRSMALLVVQERSRWLDRGGIVGNPRKVALDEKVSPDALFGTSLETLTAQWEQQKKEGEALRAYLPRKAPPPPPAPYRAYQTPTSTSGAHRRPSSQPPPPGRRPARRDDSREQRAPRRRTDTPSPAVRGGHRGGRKGEPSKRSRT